MTTYPIANLHKFRRRLRRVSTIRQRSQRTGFLVEEFDILTLELNVRNVDHQLPFHRRTLQVPFLFNSTETPALIDSGATGYFIDHKFVNTHGIQTEQLLLPIAVKNVDDSDNITGRIKEKVRLSFKILG